MLGVRIIFCHCGLLTLCGVSASCASLSGGGHNVYLTSKPNDAKDCRLLGNVYANPPFGLPVGLSDDWKAKLRNETADLGGDVVVAESPGMGDVSGTAYSCRRSAGSAGRKDPSVGARASTPALRPPAPAQVALPLSDAPERSSAVAAAGLTKSPAAIARSAGTARSTSAPSGWLSGSPQPTAYALVVGIENYGAEIPPAKGAHSDAAKFAQLAIKSLGVQPAHVQTLFDEHATKGSIESALEWVQTSTPAGGRIYFYFSGHGAPDPSSGTPYIVPSDGNPKYLKASGLALKDALAKLGQSKAREVLAIVDSCFSGRGGRSVLPPGTRPLIQIKEEAAPIQLALFASAGHNEISGPGPSGSEGLFTHYFVQGLGTGAADINGDGQVSLAELAEWVNPRVSRDAKKDNRDQNPALVVGRGLGSPESFIIEWGLPAK